MRGTTYQISAVDGMGGIIESRFADLPEVAIRIENTLRRDFPGAAIRVEKIDRNTPIFPGPDLMPRHLTPPKEQTMPTPTTDAAAAQVEDLPPDPVAEQTDDQGDDARRTRRRRVATIAIPDEVHALATLLGRDAADLIQSLLDAQVATVRAQAANALCGVLP
jgi:hypothetical protein